MKRMYITTSTTTGEASVAGECLGWSELRMVHKCSLTTFLVWYFTERMNGTAFLVLFSFTVYMSFLVFTQILPQKSNSAELSIVGN